MQVFSLFATALLSMRPIQFVDVPADLRPLLSVRDASGFHALRRKIERDTADRERRGEEEHLVYFVLQSKVFTKRPKIEPALSARESSGGASVPADVRERMFDFLDALARPTSDRRLAYWQSYLGAKPRSWKGLAAAYTRAMRFLYEKEFVAGADSTVYQRRGYSTDTEVEANLAVSTALAVLRALDSNLRVDRALIVGPGMDFAPRTGLRDDLPAQSYQPYLTADILLRRRLSSADRLSIHCVDISPRVVHFIEEFSLQGAPTLVLPHLLLDPEFAGDFEALGEQIGRVFEGPTGKIIRVEKGLAARIRASQLNILVERYDPAPNFDLVIATNVLLYFDATELALALTNIASMMRPGAYLMHNELRPEVEAISKVLQMPPIQGRTLRVASGAKRPLLDSFVIHRKS